MLQDRRIQILLIILFLTLVYAMIFMSAHPQDQLYHNFSDEMELFGVSNFHNVFSNIGFVLAGVFGFNRSKKYPGRYGIAWIIFFIGVILTGFGSTYYHLNPNDQTLVWDRLPMTVGFTSIVASLFIELYNLKKPKIILSFMICLGLYSIVHWVSFDDLRIYGWLQLSTIFTLIYVALIFKPRFLNNKFLGFAIMFYIIAKAVEHNDVTVHNALGYSGHSLKHLLAAIAVIFLIFMKKDNAS